MLKLIQPLQHVPTRKSLQLSVMVPCLTKANDLCYQTCVIKKQQIKPKQKRRTAWVVVCMLV